MFLTHRDKQLQTALVQIGIRLTSLPVVMRGCDELTGCHFAVCSTKIPFKGTSKEYIGEDAKAINEAITRGIMASARQLQHSL